MDLFKALTGKNPAEYRRAAEALVNTPDVQLYKKLVAQDDFLFDFVKNNVSKRIFEVCNKENYLNLLKFLDYYSASYDTVISEILYKFGGSELFPKMKELFLTGSNENKAYVARYFSFYDNNYLNELIEQIRIAAKSDFEPLRVNSIELLSKLNDSVSKNEALEKLASKDEFEQYEAIKFLINFGAKDSLERIIQIMKTSSLAENIAAEIPFLTTINELLATNFDDGILVLCNIVNAMPEVISLSAVTDYNMFEIFENLYLENLTSTSAILLRMAKEKFNSVCETDEYLYDCDKNTKEEVLAINKLLKDINIQKLNSLIYEELYEESDFVFYAVDFADDIEELETLLDSKNQTLILKVLTHLKDKNVLNDSHKQTALHSISMPAIKEIVKVL